MEIVGRKNTLEKSGEDVKATPETSGEDVKTTPQTSVEDVKTTLETSGEDVGFSVFVVNIVQCVFEIGLMHVTGLSDDVRMEFKEACTKSMGIEIHSKRVGKMENYTRNEWGRSKTTLETSGEDLKLHSKRVGKI